MSNFVKIDYNYAKFKARYLLRKYGIQSTPVDLIKIIGFLPNVQLYYDDLITEDAYVYYFDPTNTFAIYINKNCNSKRTRFSIAHEIGHIYLEHFAKYNVLNLTDRQLMYLDKEANAFANELLVPDCLFAQHINESVEELANTFYVSQEVIKVKLVNY